MWKTLIDGNLIFTEFKGALTEQYVLQQLVTDNEISIFYWSSDKSDGKIDLLIQYKNELIPIEVKAAENLQAKSLGLLLKKINRRWQYVPLCLISEKNDG